MPTFTLAGLLALFGTATMILMQKLLKPLFELIPGIRLKVNQGLHDNLLRVIQYSVNLAMLVCAARFGGAALFVGWHWWDFMAAAIGSATVSQYSYSSASSGGTGFVDPTPVQATLTVSTTPPPSFMAPAPEIPTVPR